MLRRSQSQTQKDLLSPDIPTRSITLPPKKKPEFIDTTEASQLKSIDNLFQTNYGYHGKDEQNESAVHLLHGRPVFLLAGTGFGKSRVPEVFYLAHDHTKFAPIILSINPLDTLGDDQVSKKRMVDLGSINLNGPNCTQANCDMIIAGKYPFVYVSPEVALTSKIFDKMWRDPRFQARLILNVVDEAHMIYEWGLVASGEAKKSASHTRVQDGGVF